MKSHLYAIILSAGILTGTQVSAQVGIGTSTPNSRAVLELKSPTNDQGFLVPRLTTAQRNAITGLTAEENGLMVYDSDTHKFYYWQDTEWLPIRSGSDVALVAGEGIEITEDTISAIADGDGNSINEIQNLELTGTILKITNNASATSIDLAPFINTDSTVSNEIQDLELTGNTLRITNNVSATDIDLTPYIDADGSVTNEIQDLELTGTTLKISNNTSATPIDLTSFIDADGSITNEIQDLELTGNTLKISNNASATDIDLTPYIDADGSVTNEIQDLQLVGSTLTITNNASATNIDLAPFAGTNTDNQTLSFNSTSGVLSITGGNTVTVTPTGAASGDLSGTYPNPTIANNAISTSKISPSVTNGQVLTTVGGQTQWAALPSTVTSITTGTGLTGGPITSTGTISIAANGVTSTQLQSDVSTDANRAVTTNHIRDAAVTTGKILDGTIANADISSTAGINVSKLGPGTNGQILTTVSGSPQWAAPSTAVTSITTGTGLTGGPITSTGTISIANNGVTSTQLQGDASTDANRAVTTNHIRDAAVTTTKLSNTGVTAGTYGSATQIPRFTVDAKGRLTSASFVTAAGGTTQNLAEVLETGNDAGGNEAHGFKAVSVNWSKGDKYGALSVNGSQFVNFTLVNADYTVKAEDYLLLVKSGTEKPATIILPSAADNKGRLLIIRVVGVTAAEGATVNSPEGIDGESTSGLLYYNTGIPYSITVISDGKTWYTINRAITPNKG